MNLIPKYIKEKIQAKPYLSNIINNIGWLFFDKAFRLGVGLFVGAWMARYLGPEQLGLLNYVLAIMGFLVIIANFGLNIIIVKDLVNEPQQQNEILGTACFIQVITSLLSFLLLLALSSIVFEDKLTRFVAILIGFTLLFKPIDTIRYYFEANTQSKYIVWAENCSFIICSIIKIVLFIIGASLITIAGIFLVDAIIISLLIILAYLYNKQQLSTWKINTKRLKQNIKHCWPLILTGLTVIFYMRIDQIMLSHMLNYEAVGIYTAATKLSEIWYFVPLAIMASVNPALISAKAVNEENYYNKLALIINILVLMSIIIAIITTLFAPFIIDILYGEKYQASANVLIIHIWTGVFVSMGVATTQWMVIQNLQILSLYRALVGAVVNIILNLLLISSFGPLGAAFATLIAQLCVTFLYDAFDPKVKRLFWIKAKALNIVYSIKALLKYAKLNKDTP